MVPAVRPRIVPAAGFGRMLAVRVAVLAAMAFPAAAHGQTPAGAAPRIDVDFSQVTGTIRPLHGLAGGPLGENFTVDVSPYFRELQVPYVRFHSPNWPNPNFVCVQYIFPDLEKDPDDPANYDFKLTDQYIAAMIAVGAKPIYNLGQGADPAMLNNNRYYRSKTGIPPKDFAKWARVCVNITRHYNQGWANGFKYDITYWEIWNEPNLPNWWEGTVEQFAEFYATVATALKQHDPALKVGGPGVYVPPQTNFDWIRPFLALSRKHEVPLDFFSWHFYHTDPSAALSQTLEVKQLLEEQGYPRAEILITEWSYAPLRDSETRENPAKAREFYTRQGNSEGAAFNLSVLRYLQDSPVAIATFYAGDTISYGIFDREGVPKDTYYGFKAFRRLLDTPSRVKAEETGLPPGATVLAGVAPDGSKAGILISSLPSEVKSYDVHIRGLPWKSRDTTVVRSTLDRAHEFELMGTQVLTAAESAVLTLPVGAPSVHFLTLTPVTPDLPQR